MYFAWILPVLCTMLRLVDMKVIPYKEARHRREETPNVDSIKYLTRYGYLEQHEATTDGHAAVGASRPEEELRSAVEEFQRMANLPTTGRLDEPTLLMMRKPRCGKADVVALDRRTPQEFKVGSEKWKKSRISYRLDKSTTDLRRNQVESEIARAFDLWSAAVPLTFHPVPAEQRRRPQQQKEDGRQTADIVLSFLVGEHGDDTDFDGKGNILAHAYAPGEGTGGDVHFDDAETWTMASNDGVNLFTVAAHELGHSLGIQHSKVLESLMFPWYQGYDPKYKQLHQDDVRAVQSLYGQKSDSPTVVSTDSEGSTQPTVCCTDFDAVASIRGELFFFKSKWFWRRDGNWKIRENPELITRLWQELPPEVESIDAVYERPNDNRIVFFSGKRYFEFNGLVAETGFPRKGRPLTDLGLPSEVDRIDAVLVWGEHPNRRVYVYSGTKQWRLDSAGKRVDTSYSGDRKESSSSSSRRYFPSSKTKPIEQEPPAILLPPVGPSFTHPDGGIYVFKETYYWKLDGNNKEMSANDRKPIRQLWSNCDFSSSSSSASSSALSYTVLFLLLFWTINRNS